MGFQAVHFPLDDDPVTRGLREVEDLAQYADQAIRQLLLTGPGDRVHRPDLGVGLLKALFAPTSDASPTLVQTLVVEGLERWLSRYIAVDAVDVRSGEARVEVDVHYRLRTGDASATTSVELLL